MTDEVNKLTNSFENINVGKASKTEFRWNVDVPEFVPKSSVVTNVANSASPNSQEITAAEQSSASKSYADAAKKCGVAPTSVAPSGDSSTNSEGAYTAGEPVSVISGFLHDLLNDPEDVENICTTITDYLNNRIVDEASLTAAINCVLDTALSVENFAYLCTRVLIVMHDTYTPAAENINFRNCLLSCMESEFKNSASLIKDSALSSRVRNFAYVLCELSLNVLLDGRPLKVLAKALYSLLDVIVSVSTDENVRYAINVLKGIGAHLENVEKHETKGATPLMNGLIDRLECIGTNPSSGLSENTKFIIRNLRGVRRHWAYTSPSTPSYEDQSAAAAGASTAPPAATPFDNAQVPPSVVIDPPAYYFAPESLSAEETAFYEQQCRAAGVQISFSSDNDATTGSEDDAIADAYEEFLSSVQRR